jgi:hypothetical protein
VAAFIRGSVVVFTELPRWNRVTKIIFQQEKAESPKQQVFKTVKPKFMAYNSNNNKK